MAETEILSPENKKEPRPEEATYLFSLIDKFVTIKMIANYSYSGYIHSIDPISKSMILSVPKDQDNFQQILILGHSVLDITEITPTNDKKPTRKNIPVISVEEKLSRKLIVIAWLKKNLLPVSEKDDVIDLGNVSILPPYTVMDLCTDNAVVAAEIKKILANMPENFHP